MGQDKALLPFRNATLAQHVAQQVSNAAQSVFLVGDPIIYGHLGFETIPDAAPDRGPLSGMEAALGSQHAAEWNLIVACDMPRLQTALFEHLIHLASQAPPQIDCLVPRTNGRLQPLCALYRRRCAQPITRALGQGTRRVVDMVAMLHSSIWDGADAQQFANVNTRPEWNAFLADSADDRRISSLP